MFIFNYHDRLKVKREHCEVCKSRFNPEQLEPHHIYRKKYGDECIWACDLCHRKIENPSAFGLPATWSYDMGYLIKNSINSMATKRKTVKKCTHKAKIFNLQKGCFVCQFCNKEVGND